LREAEISGTKRFINVFRQQRLNQELDEEIASHIAEGIEQGRDPEEVLASVRQHATPPRPELGREGYRLDAIVLTVPWLIMTAAVLLSAVPSVIRAVRIDPAQTLRVE
jgi:hypothetical protein